GLYVHGNNDVDGAILGVHKIVKGLGWRQVAEPVRSVPDAGADARDACWELGAVVAASIS
ncbi:MAG: flavodoxin, partial [Microthrixaceae bacterium]